MIDNISVWFNRRMLSILFLGFSSGLPLVLVSSTLQAWYTSAGVNLMGIGMLSLVGQPYVFKFIWAPLFDWFTPMNALGKRRSWILLMQFSLAISLAVMAFLNPKLNPLLLACIAFIAAFFSASQDIGIDAYRTNLLTEKERGPGTSLTTVGYRGGMLVAGAFTLILADHLGWRNAYLIMAGLMLMEMVITFWAPKPEFEFEKPLKLSRAVIEPLIEFIKRKHALLIIIFLVAYKLCDAFALALNTTFLLRAIGFTLTELGAITKTLGLTAAITGSILGGMLLPKLGLYRSLLYFGILQILSNLPFALLAIVGKNDWLMASTVFIEFFCGCLSNVALIVFLMKLCDKRHTATQFAIFSAIVSLGRVFSGPIVAVLVEHLGWAWFYLSTAIIGLPAIILLKWLHREPALFEEHQVLNIDHEEKPTALYPTRQTQTLSFGHK